MTSPGCYSGREHIYDQPLSEQDKASSVELPKITYDNIAYETLLGQDRVARFASIVFQDDSYFPQRKLSVARVMMLCLADHLISMRDLSEAQVYGILRHIWAPVQCHGAAIDLAWPEAPLPVFRVGIYDRRWVSCEGVEYYDFHTTKTRKTLVPLPIESVLLDLNGLYFNAIERLKHEQNLRESRGPRQAEAQGQEQASPDES